MLEQLNSQLDEMFDTFLSEVEQIEQASFSSDGDNLRSKRLAFSHFCFNISPTVYFCIFVVVHLVLYHQGNVELFKLSYDVGPSFDVIKQ